MSFEIRDGKEPLPDEEDIYDVNDIEDQERFNYLLGHNFMSQEQRLRARRRVIIVTNAVLLLLSLISFLVMVYLKIFFH